MKSWYLETRIQTAGRCATPQSFSLTSAPQLVMPTWTGPSGVWTSSGPPLSARARLGQRAVVVLPADLVHGHRVRIGLQAAGPADQLQVAALEWRAGRELPERDRLRDAVSEQAQPAFRAARAALRRWARRSSTGVMFGTGLSRMTRARSLTAIAFCGRLWANGNESLKPGRDRHAPRRRRSRTGGGPDSGSATRR